jgi:ATP synthase protein I
MEDLNPAQDLKQAKKQAFYIIYTQMGSLAGVIVLFALFSSKKAAFSAFLGGLTAVLPALVMLIKFFSPKHKTLTQKVRALYKAEAMKWLLTAALFVVFIKNFSIEPLSFFISFIAALLAYWLVLIATMQIK